MNAPLFHDIAPPSNSFVLPEHKLVYITVTKVACTSLRWMVADLAGEDRDRFYRASGSHQSRLMTIHTGREAWTHAKQIKNIAPDELAEISRDNGWFVFAVIRDPWTRLWSAWQSKFLVRHTPYLREFGDEPWFPRIPTKPDEIIEDWATFVQVAPWKTNPLLKKDRHFMGQFSSVRPRGINYTKIYDISDLSSLFTDLHTHLRGLGKDQDLYTPRANENPIPITAEALDNGVAERIKKLYAREFREWGDRWSLDKIKFAQPLGMDAVNAISYHASANQRIGDLSHELKKTQQRQDQLEAKLQAKTAEAAKAVTAAKALANRKPPSLKARAHRFARRVRAKLRAMIATRRAR